MKRTEQDYDIGYIDIFGQYWINEEQYLEYEKSLDVHKFCIAPDGELWPSIEDYNNYHSIPYEIDGYVWSSKAEYHKHLGELLEKDGAGKGKR